MRERECNNFHIFGLSVLGRRYDKLERQYEYKRNIECFRVNIIAVEKK